jgi:hypothetical protein
MTCWYVAGGELRKPQSEASSATGEADPDPGDPGGEELDGGDPEDELQATKSMPSRAVRVGR